MGTTQADANSRSVSDVSLRTMRRGDLAAAMRLKSLANWNQTEADWLRLLALMPTGCGVAERGGRTVGTVTTIALLSSSRETSTEFLLNARISGRA